MDREFVQAHFPTPDRYADFVSAYLADRRLPDELQSYLRTWEG